MSTRHKLPLTPQHQPAMRHSRKAATTQTGKAVPARTPDPILAELWQIKAQINQAAAYDIATLIKQTEQAAKAGWPSTQRKKKPASAH
jgi:hypothetical protein